MKVCVSVVGIFAQIGYYEGMSVLNGGSGRSEKPALVPTFPSFTRTKYSGTKFAPLPLCRHFTPSLGLSTREENLLPLPLRLRRSGRREFSSLVLSPRDGVKSRHAGRREILPPCTLP